MTLFPGLLLKVAIEKPRGHGSTQISAVERGAGAIAAWDVADWLDVRVGYLAENNEFLPGVRPASNPAMGLFGDTSTLTGQLGLQPTDNLNLRLLYTRSNLATSTLRGVAIVGGSLSLLSPLGHLALQEAFLLMAKLIGLETTNQDFTGHRSYRTRPGEKRETPVNLS